MGLEPCISCGTTIETDGAKKKNAPRLPAPGETLRISFRHFRLMAAFSKNVFAERLRRRIPLPTDVRGCPELRKPNPGTERSAA